MSWLWKTVPLTLNHPLISSDMHSTLAACPEWRNRRAWLSWWAECDGVRQTCCLSTNYSCWRVKTFNYESDGVLRSRNQLSLIHGWWCSAFVPQKWFQRIKSHWLYEPPWFSLLYCKNDYTVCIMSASPRLECNIFPHNCAPNERSWFFFTPQKPLITLRAVQ